MQRADVPGVSLGPATNVVAPRTSFVGRRNVLDMLEAKLDAGARLLTLTGPGGVGKSRLAWELALRRVARLPGGAWTCDLTQTTTLPELCATVAATLDVALPRAQGDAVAMLAAALARRPRTLLILDNVEQILEAAALAVDRWLDATALIEVVATSREALRVAGEVVSVVPPLDVRTDDPIGEPSEAVELFIDRCRTVHPTFSPERWGATLTDIVAQLDGLPLAIELAATHVPTLSPTEILAELPRRFDLLTRGSRLATDRQRTLKGAIDWSWTLLSPDEKSALAQCSVFEGAFERTDAEAILELSSPTLAAVAALHDKSLLNVADPSSGADAPRFSLYVSIREYAAVKLVETGAASATRARHARHYLAKGRALCDALATHDGARGMRTLAGDFDNLLAVHRRAVASGADGARDALEAVVVLGPLLAHRGQLAFHAELADRALGLARDDRVAAALVAEALIARGYARRKLGRLVDATEDLDQALLLARAVADRRLQARALGSLGSVATARGDFHAAEQRLAIAAELARGEGDRVQEGAILSALGRVHHMRGADLDRARGAYEAALALHEAVGNRRSEARTRARLGFLLQDLGQLAEAETQYEEALRIARSIEHLANEAFAHLYLGNLARGAGRIEQAVEKYQAALALFRRVGELHFEGITRMDLGIAELLAMRVDEAERHFEEARSLLARLDDRWCGALVASYLACIWAERGALDHADALVGEAEERLAEHGDAVFARVVALNRAGVRLVRVQSASEVERAAHVAAVRAMLAKARASDAAVRSQHLDIAAALLARLLERYDDGSASLLVSGDGTRFRAPGGQIVDLSNRPQLCRLLALLTEQRLRAPGRACSGEALFDAVWRGERAVRAAKLNRVRVAVSTLRRLGLTDVLKTAADGYSLDEHTPVAAIDEAAR